MPTDAHEAFLELFRVGPALLAELLGEVGGLPVDGRAAVSQGTEGLTQRSAELRPDAVWRVSHGASRWVVVLEVQRGRDPRKRLSWPLYEWAARKQHHCPAVVVVVAPDARVGRWAAKPILTPTGGSFRPLVISPATLTPVRDVEKAKRSPLRAVLVAMLYGDAEPDLAVEVAATAAEAMQVLPQPQVRLCLDLMEATMPPESLARWEEWMSEAGYTWRSPINQRILREGREAGLQEGRDQALRELVGQQLEIRFGPLSPDVSQRLREEDLDEVQRWAHRVVTAERLEDVFGVKAPDGS